MSYISLLPVVTSHTYLTTVPIISVAQLFILQVVHCDLALRNIMVNHFPKEVKLAEFGLAQDLTHKRSHRSSCKGNHMVRRTVLKSPRHCDQSIKLPLTWLFFVLRFTAKCAPALVSPRVLQKQLLQLQRGCLGIWHCAVGDANIW